MKKLSRILIPGLLVAASATLAACGTVTAAEYEKGNPVKIGLITLHDETSTYDGNFINSMKAAARTLGNKVDGEVIIKTGVDENNKCYSAARDLVKQGCNFIFADSFGHEPFLLKAAKKWPSVQFGHATGTQAKIANVKNFHNGFASIYEGRYLAGYAAGLKLQKMVAAGEIKDANKTANGDIKLGYVGAFQYAEVISGFTSWYLGVKAVVPNVVMDVTFTKSWYDPQAEGDGARALINAGAAIVSQHADSMGAPSACETARVPNVTYNVPTATECPNTYLAYSKIDWAPYFVNAVESMYDGVDGFRGEVNNNWTGTMQNGAVVYDVADATDKAACELVKAELIAGTRKVFDCANFTVKGEHLTTQKADVDDFGDFVAETEAIKTENGLTYYNESAHRSAPYFDLIIDGITLLNSGFAD